MATIANRSEHCVSYLLFNVPVQMYINELQNGILMFLFHPECYGSDETALNTNFGLKSTLIKFHAEWSH